MGNTPPTIQDILRDRGPQGAIEYLAEEIEKLKAAYVNPSSSTQKPETAEEDKGVSRG